MGLDVRLPIGAFFVLLGILLLIYGIVSNPAIYARSLGININLNWGGALLGFGLMLLFLGLRAKKTSQHGD